MSGTGDFNGDGLTDILWRGAGGEVATWDMNNNQLTSASLVTSGGSADNPGSYWEVTKMS